MNPQSHSPISSRLQAQKLTTSHELPHLSQTLADNDSKKQQQQKQIKRTKKHEAILKVKQVQEHIYVMKRRHQYLEVKDEENRSKTIQHERKIQIYGKRRQEAKRDRLVIERDRRSRMQELDEVKEKNMALKQQIEKKVAQSLQKFHIDRVQQYQKQKQAQIKNEQKVLSHRSLELKKKQEKRNSVQQMQQISKTNISRLKQQREKQSIDYKNKEYEALMLQASRRQKQLSRLSKLEEDMIKKNSQSMQISQIAKNKLREIYGNQRRHLKLPSIHGKNSSSQVNTRSSTGNTQVLTVL